MERKRAEEFIWNVSKDGVNFSTIDDLVILVKLTQSLHRYSLQQCQQTYAHMDLDLKNNLFSKVDELAPEYGLTELTYASFIRKAGYRSDISSADTVEGLGALLEVATGVRLDFGNGGVGTGAAGGGREEWSEGVKNWVKRDGSGSSVENKRPENGEVDEDEEGAAAAAMEKREFDWATRNFWLAWDALSPESVFGHSETCLSSCRLTDRL